MANAVITLLDYLSAQYKVKVRDDGSAGTSQYVISEGIKGALTDASGSITTGGTSQQVYAANSSRIYLYIANPEDATETLYVNIGASASTTARNSYELPPGADLPFDSSGFIPSGAVNVVAATTGSKFIAKESTVP